ncbi:uncharacterized protein F5147DRAFT_662327 [Suillus discolor]|uniref:Uncharacterized protein n=1 Tax=Suillus discolor TaxID=1912936 RepID=A0A9P7FJD7_9AGAM|nr:uncharacterized protein F5147DRAFT_662327 [Suillus discolor]KAG2120524.1 hypothetical protein F5147DRAFT_662327 [Suillus discolor]
MAAAYPEYVACFEASPRAFFSGEPPAGQLLFALPEVANFTASLFANIAKTLPSHYFRESAPAAMKLTRTVTPMTTPRNSSLRGLA